MTLALHVPSHDPDPTELIRRLLTRCVGHAVTYRALDLAEARINGADLVFLDALQDVLRSFPFEAIIAAMRACRDWTAQQVRSLAESAVNANSKLRAEYALQRGYIRWAASVASGWARRFKLYDFVGVPLLTPRDLIRFFPARVPHFAPGDSPSGLKSYFLAVPLGHGSFGEVWTALNKRCPQGIPRVVKFGFRPDGGQRLSHEFLASEQIKRAVTNQFLVHVDLAHLDEDPPFLVFPYASENPDATVFSLSEYLEARRFASHPLSVQFVALMLYQLALTVGQMHERWLVHRDLKPSNLLIYEDSPGRWRVKVLDFGISGGAGFDPEACQLGPSSKRIQGQLLGKCGTPPYAPEAQMLGEPAQPDHDVYALGMIAAAVLMPERALSRTAPLGHWLEEQGVDSAFVRIVEDCVALDASLPNGRALASRLRVYLQTRAKKNAPAEGQGPQRSAETFSPTADPGGNLI